MRVRNTYFSWVEVLSGNGWTVLLILLFSSCLPDPLEAKDTPVIKTQIVISTQIVPDQSLVVILTKTIGALEVNDDDIDPLDLLAQVAINDALVTISGPASMDTLLFLGNGFY